MRQELREKILKLYAGRLTPDFVNEEERVRLIGELEEVLEQADKEADNFMLQGIDYKMISDLCQNKDEAFSRMTAQRVKSLLTKAGILTHRDLAEKYNGWISHGKPDDVDSFFRAIEGCGEHTTALLKQYCAAVGFRFDRDYIRDAAEQ